MKKSAGAIAFLGACLFVACLPGDIRPEPASVFVSVEPGDAALNGFVTDDGWTIYFDKLLVGIGDTILSGENCEVYGSARYPVLFDFTVPGKQKLGDVYGLQTCDLQFHAEFANWYLGKGVVQEDRLLIFDRDDIVAHGYRAPSVYMRGNATRGDVTKHFAWKFRDDYALTECEDSTGKLINIGLQLNGGDVLRPLVTFHPEAVFRDSEEKDAKIRFDPLAATDTNADGELTLEELSQIPAPIEELTWGELGDAGVPDGGYLIDDLSAPPGWPRFMAQRLLVGAFRLDGNVCRDEPLRSKRWEPPSRYEL